MQVSLSIQGENARMDTGVDGYIVGDNCKILCKSVETVHIFITLLACYYCFDLSYPCIYSQLLGFLQQFVMYDPYSLGKSSDHKHLTAQYQKSHWVKNFHIYGFFRHMFISLDLILHQVSIRFST